MLIEQNKIKAYIVNRNLLTSLKGTVEFLLKEPRVEVIIFDQASTYPPLLEYYKSLADYGKTITVVYNHTNDGPHSVWGPKLKEYFNSNHYIVADSDCDYSGVPEDWLDRLLAGFELKTINKIGFSLEINDLPNNELSEEVIAWEKQFWKTKAHIGWIADIDTTFALYRASSGFTYNAVRLDRPYTIKHLPWYIKELDEEWTYYLENISSVSTWGQKLKKALT